MALTPVPDPVLDARNEDLAAAQAIGALPSELSDRSDSNPAVVILEACAWLLGKGLYIANRWPAAVIQKALALIGVPLNPATAGQVQQRFVLASPRPLDTPVPQGTHVATADGKTIYQTLADLAIPGYIAPLGTLTLTAGLTGVACSAHSFVTGSSWVGWMIGIQGTSGSAPAQWYVIASVSDDQHLVLTTPASSSASGAFYVGPVAGSVAAQGTTPGTASTVGANTLSVLQDSVAGVDTTTNPAASTPGTDIESIDAAIARAPVAFATRDMACTAGDFAEFSRRVLGPGGRAVAQPNFNVNAPAPGYVSVALLSPKWTPSSPISAIERAAVRRDLANRTFVGATVIDVAPVIYSALSSPALVPAVAFVRVATTDPATAQANVAAALNSYLSPNTFPFGQEIRIAELANAARQAVGVARIVEINGVLAASTNYQVCPATLNVTTGSNSVATANTTGMQAGRTFIIDAANQQVYLVTAIGVGPGPLTLDRPWTGGSNATLATSFFNAVDDDQNAGFGLLWYGLPYANLGGSLSSMICTGSA